MTKTAKSKIHIADILLRCSKKEHENCAALRDSLLENFKNVTKAYTTRTVLDTVYCVSATAIVEDGQINKFKKQLRDFKKPNSFKVSRARLYVNRH